MKPLIRWVGGKTKLLSEIKQRMPAQINRYIEPFLGGGAVLLSIDKSIPAIACDANAELINFFCVLKHQPEDLMFEFRKLQNTKEVFYEIRGWDRMSGFILRSPLERAVRFLFLNKTSFQGLWRVNRKGQHNVPYSSPSKIQVKDSDVMGISERIQNVDFVCGDFDSAIKTASNDDFIYADPPYIPVNINETFCGYTDTLFPYEDQVRLLESCVSASNRGAKFLLSNSDTSKSNELYEQFDIDVVTVKRTISPKNSTRGNCTEILVRNFKNAE